MPPKCKPDDIDRIVGKNIRAERERLKWSRPVLGDLVGLTGVTIYKYEGGMIRIPLSNYVAICKAMGRAPSFFLRGAV